MLNEKLYRIEDEDAFSKQIRLVNEYKASHPGKEIISLGIGDVSFPVARPIADAMKKACDELTDMDHFQGYGAYWGIDSLRKTIAKKDYDGLDISYEEIYVGDGTKTDSTAILELFASDVKILTGDPTYPIYKNGAYALGRDISFGNCDSEFKMLIPKEHFDIIYICSPCNPVGNAYTRNELKKWIDYANENKAYIIYDNVYKDFIESPDVPQSIYEIEGSRTCAIEMRSFSKNASFSGTRCSYYVMPKEFGEEIHRLWRERTMNRFNGASYIAQKGAEAFYTEEAQQLVKKNISVYKDNASKLRKVLISSGFDVTGGIDSPYLWVMTPERLECWDAFKYFLEELNIVVVPGAIFGSNGRYHIRISSLGTGESTDKACKRIGEHYEKRR